MIAPTASPPASAGAASQRQPARTRPRLTRQGGIWSLAALVFLVTFVFRLLDPELLNDHFWWISAGRQILAYGELPFRDFWEPGYFLQCFTSALLQLIFGYNLLGEALFSIFFIALGTALTFLLAARASRSVVIGLLGAAFVLMTYPRLYHYHKVFFYVFALLLIWRYIDRPSRRNLVLVALCTALAFLFRHDHGIYIGAAALAALIATHWKAGPRLLARAGALYLTTALAPVVPFLVFVQVNGGIITYFREGTEFSLRERDRSMAALPPRFVIDPTAPLLALAPPTASPARINVRWAPGVTDDQRLALEQRYTLTNARRLADDPRGRSWGYTIEDTSDKNLRRLARDPRVEDTLYRPAPKASLLDTLQQTWPLLRLRLAPGLIRPENAAPWLYTLFLALPVLTLAALRFGRRPAPLEKGVLPNETPKMIATATLCGIAAPVLLRAPLAARFADIAGPTAVLGAWLLGRWVPKDSLAVVRRALRIRVHGSHGGSFQLRLRAALLRPFARTMLAVALLALTFVSIASVAEGGTWMASRVDPDGLGPTLDLAARRITRLAVSPPLEQWAPAGSTGVRGIVRYIAACTEPTDRLVVTWFAPEIFYYAGRGYPNRSRLLSQRIPVILLDTDDYRQLVIKYGPGLLDLLRYYRVAMDPAPDNERRYRLLVDTRLQPTGQYPPLGLPCFTAPTSSLTAGASVAASVRAAAGASLPTS